MIFALLILTLATIPHDLITHDRIDRLETNHCYDSEGKHQFTQRIFWEWNGDDCRYEIRAYRLVKPDSLLDSKSLVFHDGYNLRRVTFGHHIETWTQYDIELIDRETFPALKRRELSKPRKPERSVLKGK